MRDPERERQTQAEGAAGSMQGAWCGTRSQDSRITPRAEGGASTKAPLGFLSGSPTTHLTRPLLTFITALKPIFNAASFQVLTRVTFAVSATLSILASLRHPSQMGLCLLLERLSSLFNYTWRGAFADHKAILKCFLFLAEPFLASRPGLSFALYSVCHSAQYKLDNGGTDKTTECN